MAFQWYPTTSTSTTFDMLGRETRDDDVKTDGDNYGSVTGSGSLGRITVVVQAHVDGFKALILVDDVVVHTLPNLYEDAKEARQAARKVVTEGLRRAFAQVAP